MNPHFLTSLSATQITEDIWRLDQPLSYYSKVLKKWVKVPWMFYCDFESVPRIPLVYAYLGHTTRRGGCVHDFLYRYDCEPIVTRSQADAVYREICIVSGMEYLRSTNTIIRKAAVAKIYSQAWAKWLGVRIGGMSSYHKKSVLWMPEVCRGA